MPFPTITNIQAEDLDGIIKMNRLLQTSEDLFCQGMMPIQVC